MRGFANILIGGLVGVSAAATHATVKSQPKVPQSTATVAPGLGKASWMMLDMDPDSATYFATAHVKRAGAKGIGWFTSVFVEPRTLGDVNNVEFVQGRYEADCTTRRIKLTHLAGYDQDGKTLISGAAPDPTADAVEPDSSGGRMFNILCGRPQALASKTPVVGDHETIESNYLQEGMKQVTAAMEKEHERLMNGGSTPH